MATGILPLHEFQLGKETTAGTAVATTRQMYPDPTGYLDPGIVVTHHEGVQRGTFANVMQGDILAYQPTIGYRTEGTHGMCYDDMPIVMSQFSSGLTGTGAAADKTWTVSSGSTTHTYETFTINAGDGNQAYEMEYSVATGIEISWGFDDMTQLSIDWVGRQLTKCTIDAVAANTAPGIPSSLWTTKYATTAAGLSGASALSNTVRSCSIRWELPQRQRSYADGSLYFGQVVAASNLTGTISMTWDSAPDAVTQFDRLLSQSVSFFRFSNTGPTLGGTNYSVGIDLAVLWESVQPMASETDGVLEYALQGRIGIYDSTWTKSQVLNAVCSLAAIP
jgi:hypothetical protein